VNDCSVTTGAAAVPVPRSLRPLSTIAGPASPSPLLWNNVADVLAAYALTMRLVNGELCVRDVDPEDVEAVEVRP
jgi:hypothetical protein